jgi:hypothetical protein
MSYWKNSNVNLGIIKAGTPKKVVFQALPTIPKIKKIYPHCGCTTTKFNEKKKELVITYNNKTIPVQVQGPQSITKKIDVTYASGETEVLIIKAIKQR